MSTSSTNSAASSTSSDKPIRIAAVGLDHAHIFGQLTGLLEQGCELVGTATDDPSAAVAQEVRRRWPDVPAVEDPDRLLEDESVDLVVTAAVPVRRAPIALAALRNGKDVVTDKPGCTTTDQLQQLRDTVADTGRFWSVTFSERFEVPSVTRAGELVREGRIGRVVQTLGLGPHRVGSHLAGGRARPDWFYDPKQYGGILNDIASHQIDQFLWFTGSTSADVVTSTVGNYANPETPGLQDFGEVLLRSESAQGYIRCDWYTPDGLPTWGDGRLMILGTEGYLELRKYVDIAGREGRDHLFCVDNEGTNYIDASDAPLTYYPDLVRDVRERTTTACPQEHTFETMRLAMLAQERATVRGDAVN
jgi:predicted dehydrogenase